MEIWEMFFPESTTPACPLPSPAEIWVAFSWATSRQTLLVRPLKGLLLAHLQPGWEQWHLSLPLWSPPGLPSPAVWGGM